MNTLIIYIVILLTCVSLSSTQEDINTSSKIIQRLIDECVISDQLLLKCFKIELLKLLDNAMHLKVLNITDAISLIKDTRVPRNVNETPINNTALKNYTDEEINDLIVSKVLEFVKTHKIKIDTPKFFQNSLEEGRRRKRKGSSLWIWGVILLGKVILSSVAYKAILLTAATALMIGNMALLLGSILGVRSANAITTAGAATLGLLGKRKTTVELVRHPHYYNNHYYANPYYDEYPRYEHVHGHPYGSPYDEDEYYRRYYQRGDQLEDLSNDSEIDEGYVSKKTHPYRQ